MNTVITKTSIATALGNDVATLWQKLIDYQAADKLHPYLKTTTIDGKRQTPMYYAPMQLNLSHRDRIQYLTRITIKKLIPYLKQIEQHKRIALTMPNSMASLKNFIISLDPLFKKATFYIGITNEDKLLHNGFDLVLFGGADSLVNDDYCRHMLKTQVVRGVGKPCGDAPGEAAAWIISEKKYQINNHIIPADYIITDKPSLRSAELQWYNLKKELLKEDLISKNCVDIKIKDLLGDLGVATLPIMLALSAHVKNNIIVQDNAIVRST